MSEDSIILTIEIIVYSGSIAFAFFMITMMLKALGFNLPSLRTRKLKREGRGGIALLTEIETGVDSDGGWSRPVWLCALDNGDIYKRSGVPPLGLRLMRDCKSPGEVWIIVQETEERSREMSFYRPHLGGAMFLQKLSPGSYEHTPNWQAIQRVMNQNRRG